MRDARHVRRAAAWGLALGLALAFLAVPNASADRPTGGLLVLLSGSESMSSALGSLTRATVAQRAVSAFVDGLPADGNAALRTYGTGAGSDACTDSSRTDFGASNRARLLAALSAYTAGGDAPMAYALGQAGADVATLNPATIVLVSDGSVGCSADPCAAASQVVADHPNVTIDVIGLDPDAGAAEKLACVAANGNGTYVAASTALELSDALDAFAESTAQPTDAEPVRVSGGADGTAAVTVLTGDYADTLGAVGTDAAVRYYAVERTIDQSDVSVAASIPVQQGVSDGISVLVTASGTLCAQSSATASSTSSVLATVALVGAGQGSSSSCLTSKRLLVKVERTSAATPAPTGSTDVVLRVSEHEPVADQASLPRTLTVPDKGSSLVAGTPVALTPGSTLRTGARIASGSTYAGSVEPGGLQTFRVSASWGQVVMAKVVLLEPKPSAKTALAKHDGKVTLRALSPLGGTAAATYSTSLTTGGSASITTDPVLYRGQDYQAQAGEYTIVVGLTVADAPEDVTIPYQLVVQTAGDETGVPTYGAPGSTSATPTATTPTSTPTRSPVVPTDTAAARLRTKVVLGVVGLLLVVVGVGGQVLLRRRRT